MTKDKTYFWGKCSKKKKTKTLPCFSVQRRSPKPTISSRHTVPKCSFRLVMLYTARYTSLDGNFIWFIGLFFLHIISLTLKS